MGTFFDQNGYDVRVTVGSLTIDTSMEAGEYGLTGSMYVNTVCGVAAEASFSFIPPEGRIYLEEWQGKEVHILIRQGNVWEQIFLGYVNNPKMDFIGRKIRLDCTDNRKNRVIQLPKSVIQGVGSYSEAVFGEAKDQAEELERRLETTASDFDFDRYGNYYFTPWLPKTVADFTFTPDDISYLDNPDLQYSNRDKTVNTRNIKLTYTYQRLHQQTCLFVWPGFEEFLRDWYNAGRPTFPAKDNIQAAATASDWKLSDPNALNYTNLWPAGGYSGVVWQPNDVTKETRGKTQLNGYLKSYNPETDSYNFVTVGDPPTLVPDYKPVLDANGNQVMEVIKETIRDTSSHLCKAVSFQSSLKFTQSITEEWNVQLRAPQAILQNKAIDSYETYQVADPYDVTKWEKSDTIAQVNYNFYYDQATKRQEQYQALQVSLNKARHDILDLHRDVTLSWRFVDLKPALDLRNTISVEINHSAIGSSSYIKAKGRVYSISHYIDFKTTEAYSNCTLKLSRARGSATNDTWFAPTIVQDSSYIGTPTQIGLGTWAGLDPETTFDSDKWTGWICNKEIVNSSGTVTRTDYQEKFVIDFPAIPDKLRDDLTVSGSAVYDLSIPNDYLETSF